MTGRIHSDSIQLRGSLPAILPRVHHPALVVVSGLPGSGKSYFSRHLVQRFAMVVLGSDVLRKTLVSQPMYDGPENRRLFRAVHVLIRQLLASGVPVLFDATNLIEAHRLHLYHIADKLDVPILVVRLEAPEAVIRRRLERRPWGLNNHDHSNADWEVYQRMRARIEPIGREHLVVDNSQDVTTSVGRAVRWLNSVTGTNDDESRAPVP